MALKPWYTVVQPREDLRENRPLDASEFAVHLDQVRDGRAPEVYKNPRKFFERTYLTQSLLAMGAEVIRRLSGERTETSAIFNMTTQFGGGKTHALTLLYHLAENGPAANRWPGVERLLDKAGVESVPRARTATFVGNEFDSISGRGGDDGTPLRKTPWGEIAYRLAGEVGLALVAEHERQMVAPGGDVIEKFLPRDTPCLILMDELMNYVSRNRRSGLSGQLYNFLQSLSEVVRGRSNVVLVVSIPMSEGEMTAEDVEDYDRFKKLLDRLGKAVIMSAESETSEIIRRRLFEWDERGISRDGRVLLNRDAEQVCLEYGRWTEENKGQLAAGFPAESATQVFASTYPFHPAVLSVFERKWQALPRFQQTRGVLRLLALWVARAYQEGYKTTVKEPLIGLGSAPLEDPQFRAAVFEQLGESRLEVAVTTDIIGKNDSHAARLDKEAGEHIKKARLHRKVATTIFFESNGGQKNGRASLPEIRFAVASPEISSADIDTALEALAPPDGACYYLDTGQNRYWFSLKPNLNKMLADKKASVKPTEVDERVRTEIQKVFTRQPGLELVFFPEKSGNIPDRPVLTLAVLDPEHNLQSSDTLPFAETLTRENSTSSRTFKSGIVWCVAELAAPLREEAKKLLAWQAIRDEDSERLDDIQKRQLEENFGKAKRNLTEAVWRSYKNLLLLDKENRLKVSDLGMVHSSAAETLTGLILNRLRSDGDVEKEINPHFLVRKWPPAFKEWSTRSVRDAFFASPQFPRLLNSEAVRETIARGVSNGSLAYLGKDGQGKYEPFYFNKPLSPEEVEISEDMYIITGEVASQYKQAQQQEQAAATTGTRTGDSTGIAEGSVGYGAGAGATTDAGQGQGVQGQTTGGLGRGEPPVEPPTRPQPGPFGPTTAAGKLVWSGEVPSTKWTNLYMKVLTKFAGPGKGLKLTVTVEVAPPEGLSQPKIDEMRAALRDLGLNDDLQVE